jgi:TPR repeat protein
MDLRAPILAIVIALLPGLALAQTDLSPEQAEERAFELLLNGDASDDGEARRLFETAGEGGRAEAMNALAAMVGNGVGGPPDLERARALLLRAARLGSIGANMSLADLHVRGAGGFPHDPERGLAYAVAAAESPDLRNAAYAQWKLAMMILNGVGAPADPARAYEWVARAADNGAVRGMISRAVMLATGEGVTPDPPAARDWYRRAAESGELGSAHGLQGLGAMLVFGEGGPVELARGYAYLTLARDGGDENAPRILQHIEPNIDDITRRQAADIAAAWRIEHGDPQPESVDGRLN